MQLQRTYTIGRLYTRPFRRGLIRWGLEFQEDKGWLDSMFTVKGPEHLMIAFHSAAVDWMRRMKEDD